MRPWTTVRRIIPGPERRLIMRRQVADVAARLATRSHDYLEYVGISHLPQARDDPRWGHGKPPHARLERIIASGADQYAASLTAIAGYGQDLAKVARTDPAPGEPLWVNNWIPGLDGAALYGLTRTLRPPRYLEVGSGVSTTWVHRARRDGSTGTTITSIDPYPRRDVDDICDAVIRQPLELTDLSPFGDLRSGDMLFVDNSHHALENSDVVTVFFDVLPELPRGVLVGIHDILLPDDYHPHWGEYYFSEQYLLGAMLLAGTSWWEPVLASWWASGQPELARLMDPVWCLPELSGLGRRDSTSFWFRTAGHLG
jgi:hypothetical protein